MTKIMITGANGRIGRHLVKQGVSPFIADMTSPFEINDTMSKEKPDIVVHLAAKSNIDWCEKPENKQVVIDTNFRGTCHLLFAAEQQKAKVVMLSSDHVFSGREWFTPYHEKRKPNPVNFYGTSKLAAENLMEAFPDFKVIRTSYLFDKERLEGMAGQSYPSFIYRSFMYLPHFISNLMQYLSELSLIHI